MNHLLAFQLDVASAPTRWAMSEKPHPETHSSNYPINMINIKLLSQEFFVINIDGWAQAKRLPRFT